jgi:TatD DNase family protein
MIDTHCHLAAKEFDHDREEVIQRARKAGVTPLIFIADTIEEGRKGVTLTQGKADLFSTVGVHPHHATDFKEEDREILKKLAQSPNVVAIGEIGLDYHYNFSPGDIQRKVFETQLRLAKELHLPAVVHTREAIDDTWTIVSSVQPEKLVLHCCTESFQNVERFIEAGYFLSFTGIATYPHAEGVRHTIKLCPLENLMLETDAPYLPPAALRAKGGRSMRNEPAFILEVAKIVAEIKRLPLEEIDRITTENTKRFFGI